MQNSEMMIRMKIGICDDEQEQGLKTKRYVESCFENSEDFYVELYDPYNLDFDIDTKRFDCDLLITDIQFENCEFDGIGIVNKINESCPQCKVIFLSNYLEYGPEVYETEHVWFIWKRNIKTLLRKAIQKAIMQEDNQNSDTIEFNSENKKTYVREKDIIYIEKVERHIEIATRSRQYTCCLSLTEIMKQLGENMVRAAGGCIVNLKHIKSVKGKEVELDNQKKIILGRRFEAPFKQAYLGYIAKQM